MTLLRGVVDDIDVIAGGAYLEIRPTGTEEWVIHNIYREAAISIQKYKDDTNKVGIEVTGAGLQAYYAIHVRNACWVRIYNDHADDKVIAWDGVLTQL